MKGMTFKVLLSALIVSNAFAAEVVAPVIAGAAEVAAPVLTGAAAPVVATGWMTTAGNAAQTAGSWTVTPLWNATKAVGRYTVVPTYNAATAHPYITASVVVGAGLGYAGYRYAYGKPAQAETAKTETTAVAEQAHAGYSTRAKIAGTAGLTTTVGGIGYGIYKYGMPSLETIKSVPSVIGSSLMALIPSFVSNNVSKKAAMILGGAIGVSALIGYTWHRIATKDTSNVIKQISDELALAYTSAACGNVVDLKDVQASLELNVQKLNTPKEFAPAVENYIQALIANLTVMNDHNVVKGVNATLITAEGQARYDDASQQYLGTKDKFVATLNYIIS